MIPNRVKTIVSLSLVLGVMAGCLSATFQGKIAVKGSEPHTYLALVTDNGVEYEITGQYKGELWEKYQGQRVKLKGAVVREAKGPGFPAVLEADRIIPDKSSSKNKYP